MTPRGLASVLAAALPPCHPACPGLLTALKGTRVSSGNSESPRLPQGSGHTCAHCPPRPCPVRRDLSNAARPRRDVAWAAPCSSGTVGDSVGLQGQGLHEVFSHNYRHDDSLLPLSPTPTSHAPWTEALLGYPIPGPSEGALLTHPAQRAWRRHVAEMVLVGWKGPSVLRFRDISLWGTTKKDSEGLRRQCGALHPHPGAVWGLQQQVTLGTAPQAPAVRVAPVSGMRCRA